MYPGVSRHGAGAPSHAESFLRRLHLEVQSLLWPSPPQWPSRPRPFQAPPILRVRRGSRASASCTTARTPRSCWRRAAPVGGRSTRRWPSCDEQAKHPRPPGGVEFSLLLGLERVLSDEEPRLRDGTLLSAHQVDALSGTLTALLAEAERSAGNGNGRAAAAASPELLASAVDPRPRRRAAGERASDGAAVTRRRSATTSRGRRRTSVDDEDEDDERTTGAPADETRTTRTSEDLGDIEDELEPLAEAEDAGCATGRRGGGGAPGLGRRGRGGRARRPAGGPQRGQALLVRARDRRRQDRRGARLRRGLADRRRPDPHAPAQPRRPVPRRAAPARLLQAHQPPAVRRRGLARRVPSRSRPTSGSCATPGASRARTRS